MMSRKTVRQGQQLRRSTETSDRKIALRILGKVKGEIAEGKWFERLPGEENTFGELMEKYMTEHSARNKAPRTHERDKSLKKHLIDFFGNRLLVEITPKLISEYKAKRREEGCAPKTLNNELTLMGHAFNLPIKEWEWVRENPVKKSQRKK
jgi:hypothetical protein